MSSAFRPTKLLAALAAIVFMLFALPSVAGAAADPPPDPTQVGFATLSNIAINGDLGTMAIVAPGAEIEITADYSVDHTRPDGSIYCPGCIDHLPLAFQGFGVQPQNASPGSPELCLGPGGANHLFHGSSGTDSVVVGNVPTDPGIYNVVAQFELTFWCGQFWNPDGGTVIAMIMVPPADKDDCKKGGWESFDGVFVDQGDCVAYVATGGTNPPGDDGDDGDGDDDDDDDDNEEDPT